MTTASNRRRSPPSARVARASGRSATASRSTPTSSSRRTTTPLNVRAPHRRHLRQAGLRQHRQAGPPRPDALDGPVHPARAGLRRHLDRRRERRHPRGQVLHDAGALRRRRADHGRAAHAGRDLHRVRPGHRRHLRPRERAVPLDPRSRTCPQIWERLDAVGLQTTEACGDCPRVVLGSPAGRRVRSTRCSTRPGPSTRSCGATSASRSSPTCRASTRPRSRACRTSRTRSTTSHSSASTIPSTAPVLTCGSAAGFRPTRCWPSASVPGFRWTRCLTSGRPSPRCSATTATAGCGARRG